MPLIEVVYVAEAQLAAVAVKRYCRATREALCDILATAPAQVRTVFRRIPPDESYLALEDSSGSMLVIKMTLLDAFTPEQHEQCHERLTHIAVETLDWVREDIRTWISLVGAREWGIGGHSFAARLNG